MIRVTIEVKGKTVCRRMRVTAPSVERALEMAGAGRPDVQARVVFPIEPEMFFAGNGFPEGVSPAPPELEKVA